MQILFLLKKKQDFWLKLHFFPRFRSLCSRQKSSLPPYSALANRKLNCQESQCQIQATNPDQLSQHLFLDHHHAKPFTDYQCAHCLEPFTSMSRLVIHVKLVHQKKFQPNLVIRHVDQALTMESDEGMKFF